MKHLLDYNVLKNYGFIWATKSKSDEISYCTSYLLTDTTFTTYHNLMPIIIESVEDFHKNNCWVIKYSNGVVLFKGFIKDKQSLVTILKSCVFIFY